MSAPSDSPVSVRTRRQQQFEFPVPPRKKQRRNTVKEAVLHISCLGIPLISRSSGQFCESFSLEPGKRYTIGRKFKLCDFVISDRRVSKAHCQLYFDSLEKKIYLSDGVLPGCSDSLPRDSTNGTFVNGGRICGIVELRVGDVVQLVCGHEETCGSGSSVGFLVKKTVFMEEVDDRSLIQLNSGNARIACCSFRSGVLDNTRVLLSHCRDILNNDDPISCICKCIALDQKNMVDFSLRNRPKYCPQPLFDCGSKSCSNRGLQIGCHNLKRVYPREIEAVKNCESRSRKEIKVVSKETEFESSDAIAAFANTENQKRGSIVDVEHNVVAGSNSLSLHSGELDFSYSRQLVEDNNFGGGVMPPGEKFYLNRLCYGNEDVEQTGNVVSLPELFHPIESLNQIFIATFTCNILWFLTYCKIPPHLSVTIACHSAERCWSSDPDKRTSVPFSNYPNLAVVYPPFPEVIAFNKDRRNLGIGCHHPKLIVLQREDRLRVVVTSANLVEKQWHNVTNTVWWQDFPRLSIPYCLPIFTQLSFGEVNVDSNCDFAAQLAGFMASLVADVPSQAHWILELVKYDFKGAAGYLVASVPGIYSDRSPFAHDSKNYLVCKGHKLKPSGAKFLSSIEASVVGLSHIYRTSADSNGQHLKKLALFLGKCPESVDGVSEIVLRRDTNIPADRNAVSVHIPNPEDLSRGDFVQLGFLPRNVAKWVAPLSDLGLFAFSAYINPKEVLATALEGSNIKVKLILYVHVGPFFSKISEVTELDHVSAICSLVSSSQRYSGLWRLKEVLCQYKWPEHLESEFLFGSSSVGCVNTQFLAAFSAAVGKRSAPFSDSEESDPDWGCWTASQELKNPSVRIIFPSIATVKSNRNGIMASRLMLCFSQKTWQRLEKVGILHDAVPYPNTRAGFPMHVKVGRRRFLSKEGSSFGWVYCGSHNFSAAAWGRPLSDQQSNGQSATGSRLHISNYELGIIFVVPPPDAVNCIKQCNRELDDIILPFVVPPPKYRPGDKPATPQAMREAMAEVSEQGRETTANASSTDLTEDDDVIMVEQEEEGLENVQYAATQEKDEEKAYADKLWSEVDSLE